MTADTTFAPYMRGLLDAIRVQPSTLRIDLRSAASAVWAWAGGDYPALARALASARTDEDGTSMGFPIFEEMFGRILRNHFTGTANTDRLDEIAVIARTLSCLTTERIDNAPTPGKSAANLSQPLIKVVAELQPDWVHDDLEDDPEELFALGAAPLVLEALLGRRSPLNVSKTLDALSRELAGGSRGNDA